jgi:membrane complex biogenesis BtpA family protein
MTIWSEELFGVRKPIIGMCHLGALPGDPGFDPEAGLQGVIEWARKDLAALQDGGVDGVMFSNEFSMPYLLRVHPVTVASMGRILGELLPQIEVPFGVDVLWDPYASLDLAVATGARFVREVFSGVYASDYGLWDPDCGEILRHRQAIGAGDVRLLFNIVPESARYLGERDIVEIARTTIFNHKPDGLCVSGITAGALTDPVLLKRVTDTAGDTPVFANTGVRLENVEQQLGIADGAIVGTTFKHEGTFTNHVDARRVREFMQKVKEIRKSE